MIYIFCGQDCCGKSSQIKRLTKYLANKHHFPLTLHCSNFGLPKKENGIYSQMYYYNFMKEVIQLNRGIYDVILDRSWLGEYVYSPLYRCTSGEYVFDFEKLLIEPDNIDEFRLITLVDSSMKNIEREDGDSFSIDVDMKRKEIELFAEAHNKSLIEKKMLLDIYQYNELDVWYKIMAFMTYNT